MSTKIGFIGQGWIGKNYADNFESRGYEVVRYSQEEEYKGNRELISSCDIVFIAVPTPTTPTGFDDRIVRDVVKLVGKGNIAVIKSTILPGTTESIQRENPDVYVFHSPEFLTEATAARDAAAPVFNIVGIPIDDDTCRDKAALVISVLPKAVAVEKICPAKEAELFKYVRNSFFFSKVVYMNLLYDLARSLGCDWQVMRDIMAKDPWIGPMHIDPVHKSGRGAGGHCFIKDFAAFVEFYKEKVGDDKGVALLEANVIKNIELLLSTGKDLDILKNIYGESILAQNNEIANHNAKN